MAKEPLKRTTICLPADLQQRMRKVRNISWSEVARIAFQAKLAAIAAEKKSKAMRPIVARLRWDKKHCGSTNYKEGHRWGWEWLSRLATAAELACIEREHARNKGDWSGPAYSSPEAYLDAVVADLPGRTSDGILRTLLGEDGYAQAELKRRDPDFIRGFVDVSLSVWARV